jgi:uncharacterized protein (DUF736 family)
MLNAVGYITKQVVGRYMGTLRTVSINTVIDILPDIQKTADCHLDFCTMTEVDVIGACWTNKGGTANKEYVSHSIAANKFGRKKLCANLGKAAGLMTRIYTP